MNFEKFQEHIKSEIEKRQKSGNEPIKRLESFKSPNSEFIKFQKADLIFFRIDNNKLYKSTYITQNQYEFFKYRYQPKEKFDLISAKDETDLFFKLIDLAHSRKNGESSQFIENILSLSITQRKLLSSFVIDEYITGSGYITDGDLKFIMQGLIR